MTLATHQDLRGLAEHWQARSKEYKKAMLVCAVTDRPYYDGLARACQFAAEDLRSYLDHHQPKKNRCQGAKDAIAAEIGETL